MSKTLFLNLFVGCAFLLSCSPTPFLKPFGLADDDRVEPYSCPLSFVPDYANLFLTSTEIVPPKVVVVVGGETKYDECQDPSVIAYMPVIRFERNKASQYKATIAASFFKDGKIPAKISIKILDRGDCSATPTNFFEENDIPLDFQVHYYNPDHSECGYYYKAEANLTN